MIKFTLLALAATAAAAATAGKTRPLCPMDLPLTTWDTCPPGSNPNNATLPAGERSPYNSERRFRVDFDEVAADCCYGDDRYQICSCRAWEVWCNLQYSDCCGAVYECVDHCACIPHDKRCGPHNPVTKQCAPPYGRDAPPVDEPVWKGLECPTC